MSDPRWTIDIEDPVRQCVASRCEWSKPEPDVKSHMEIRISDEAIGPSWGDLMAKIQRRQVNGIIASERAKLAAITDDYTAWMMYPPTPDDDPAEYAPYWSRLVDVVKDADEREAIVASWLDKNLT